MSDKQNFEEEYMFEFYDNQESPLKACAGFIESHKKGHDEDDKPFVIGLDEKPFEITNERVFKLLECEDFREIGFGDGGNAPIINS